MGFTNGKIVRVALSAQQGSDVQVNTFHYDLDDPFGQTPNDPQQLADTFRDAVRPLFAARYSSGWSILPVTVVEEFDPQNPHSPRGSWTSGSAIPGTKSIIAADLHPSFTVMVVTLRTDHIGRRFTGRLFLGGDWMETDINGNTWNATPLTAAATWLATIPHQPDLATGLSTATAKWCVYSRTQRTENLDPYASAIQTATARTLVHSLRSRAAY